ncbi:MAG TPA: sensor domain-containing diguanylate cyclase [Anaerolineales bacterium]|nr:sensor domain-containing diguanylate cyclase [Anaerolineales bacterium]HNE03871.1 sensor domain-containing diguanylate cyclase [Anaerolineales bacterium]
MFSSDDKEYLVTLFEYAPVALWEQDFSHIKKSFDELRAKGVRSLDAHLVMHPEFLDQCMGKIQVLDVNLQTVAMLKADSKEHLLSNLDKVFRDGMRHHFRDELRALWNGDVKWSGEGVNYTLEGNPVDIILNWRIMPEYENNWERVLVTTEDITARKRAEQRLHNLFEASPISLWEEDYSAIKKYFDVLRIQGVTSLESYLEEHPEAVSYCVGLINVLDVNQKTLQLFGAESKEHLIANLPRIFRDEMEEHFANELIDLWNGKLSYEREGVNYSLSGEPINILLNFKIMPGYEDDFGWALVSIQDISARKKAEEYLHYLGTHDVMTGLFNRAYFEETIQKLELSRKDPVGVIILDLNYLKKTNDTLGHQAGDKLIRRLAEVMIAAFNNGQIAARIGGDEFAVILPRTEESEMVDFIKQIHALIEINNKYYREPILSISAGFATSSPGMSLERVIQLADDAMYRSKAEYHHRRKDD